MATIGKLEAELGLNAGKYLDGMQRAAKRTGTFLQGLGRIAEVGQLGRRVIDFAAGALTDLIDNQFAAIDATAKLADRVGVTTEELTGLQHAANLSGASNEALNKSLERMTRNLGRAHDGNRSATAGFKRLGLRVESLAQMDTASQFTAIAEEISKLPNQAEKAAAAYEIFGRNGQDLLNTLEQGSGGIRAMIADAKELGVTVDRDAAAKIEAANDAIHRMSQASEGFKRQLAVALAPAVTIVADKITEWSKTTPAWIKVLEKAGDAVTGLVLGVEKLVDALARGAGGGGFFAFLERHSSTIKALGLSLETLQAAAATERAKSLGGRIVSDESEKLARRAEQAGDQKLAEFLRSGGLTKGRFSNSTAIRRRLQRAEAEAARRRGIDVDLGAKDLGRELAKHLPPLIEQESRSANRRATLERAKALERLGPGLAAFSSALAGLVDVDFDAPEQASPELAAVGTPGAVLKGTAEAFSAIRAPLRSIVEERQLEEAKLANEKADRRDRLLANRPQSVFVGSLSE